MISSAASDGAKIVCTQELFMSKYFCIDLDAGKFGLAERIPSPTTDTLCSLAKKLDIVIIASLFESRGNEIYHNTAVTIDADGKIAGKYRKMHIPHDPHFEEKYYFNEDFAALPEEIKKELKILCVLFVNEVGGILLLEYEEDGTLIFQVSSRDDDFFFDEIGSGLKIKEIQRDKEELLASLELFYKVFFLNEEIEHA